MDILTTAGRWLEAKQMQTMDVLHGEEWDIFSKKPKMRALHLCTGTLMNFPYKNGITSKTNPDT